jgi:hypothetical protein
MVRRLLYRPGMTQPLSAPRLRRTRPIYESTLRVLPPGPSTATLEVGGSPGATPTDPPASHVRVGTGTVIGLAPPRAASPSPSAPSPAEIAAPAIAAPPAPLAFADTLPGAMGPSPAELRAAIAAMAPQSARRGVQATPAARPRQPTPSKLAAPAWTAARWAAVTGVVLAAVGAGIAIGHWGF